MKGKKSKEERVNALAPLLNDAVGAFYAGRVSEGVSAFQAKLLKVIREDGLSEHKYVNAMKSGCIPTIARRRGSYRSTSTTSPVSRT